MPDIFQAYTLEQIVRTGIAVIIVLSGLISILFVIWGGFLMIISGGDEEKVKGAVNHIRHAFLGILLIIITLFVFPTLLDLLGIEYGNYMRPASVFSTISEISDTLLGRPIETVPLGWSTQSDTLPGDFSDF